MKKFCIIFLSSIIISVMTVGFCGCLQARNGKTSLVLGGDIPAEATQTDCLRMHIRAHSNDESAQAVKYLVRDEVVDYLTPLVAQYQTKTDAVAGVEAHLADIEQTATAVLCRNGFSYTATASIRQESFPTRVYQHYTLPAGEYTALIIELGEGKGDNWWCVVYPPLCFAAPSGENVVYKSKIAEIIQAWRGQ